MARSIQQVLAPKTIFQAISQIELPGTSLQGLFGWDIGGTNRAQQASRNFSCDIFDSSSPEFGLPWT